MAQQTAVEIIESALDKYFSYEYNKCTETPSVKFDLYESLKQAKQIEKQQHKYTWHDSTINSHISFEQYYTETYGK